MMDVVTANRKYDLLVTCVRAYEHSLQAEIKATEGYITLRGGSTDLTSGDDPHTWHKGRLQALKTALRDVKHMTMIYPEVN